MGFYFSKNERHCTSTLDVPPTTYLTQLGKKETDAAIIIQRWWRSLNTDSNSYTSNSSNDFNILRRRTYKRKHEDIDIDSEVDSECVEAESDLNIKEINSSEFSDSECESLIERDIQTIANNSFLWDFILSFYSFLWKLIGY